MQTLHGYGKLSCCYNEYPWADMEIECSYVARFPFDSIKENW